MSGKCKPATQETDKGLEIPIPKKGEFLRNLKKVTKKPQPSSTDRTKD